MVVISDWGVTASDKSKLWTSCGHFKCFLVVAIDILLCFWMAMAERKDSKIIFQGDAVFWMTREKMLGEGSLAKEENKREERCFVYLGGRVKCIQVSKGFGMSAR